MKDSYTMTKLFIVAIICILQSSLPTNTQISTARSLTPHEPHEQEDNSVETLAECYEVLQVHPRSV